MTKVNIKKYNTLDKNQVGEEQDGMPRKKKIIAHGWKLFDTAPKIKTKNIV